MRYWRVLVKPDGGGHFFTRAVEISPHRAVVRGEQALPVGTACDLHIIVPPPSDQQPPAMAGLRGEVREAVFASDGIRLDFSVRSLSEEVQRLFEGR
jgi:hypothetical protein